jgi:hypothetical protein
MHAVWERDDGNSTHGNSNNHINIGTARKPVFECRPPGCRLRAASGVAAVRLARLAFPSIANACLRGEAGRVVLPGGVPGRRSIRSLRPWATPDAVRAAHRSNSQRWAAHCRVVRAGTLAGGTVVCHALCYRRSWRLADLQRRSQASGCEWL